MAISVARNTTSTQIHADLGDRSQTVVLTESLLLVEGPLQSIDGVVTVRARQIRAVGLVGVVPRSRDFR